MGVDFELVLPPSMSSAKGSSDILLKLPPWGLGCEPKLTGGTLTPWDGVALNDAQPLVSLCAGFDCETPARLLKKSSFGGGWLVGGAWNVGMSQDVEVTGFG